MSTQQLQGKVRPPRVHITTEVETYGAIQLIELPFVVGILANLSGHRTPDKGLAERKFIEFEAESLDRLMSDPNNDILPRLEILVENTLQGDGSKLKVEMDFRSLADFEPASVARNVEPTRRLLEKREKLYRLLTKVEGRDRALGLLDEAVRLALGDGATDGNGTKP